MASIPNTPYSYMDGTPVGVSVDDAWSSVIDLPFAFCYFGNTYNKCVIGDNGVISFDTTLANGYCAFRIDQPLPFPGTTDPLGKNLPSNSIASVFRDFDPSINNNSMGYYVTGTAPCRSFVVYWNAMPMYGCNNFPATFQLVLHETTNAIDVYVKNSAACHSWDNGSGIIGIQNLGATIAVVPPGRNYPMEWSSLGEAWRFSPNGATPTYTYTWFNTLQLANPLGSSLNLTVSPTVTTSYTAEMILTNCNGTKTRITDNVIVDVNPSPSAAFTPVLPSQCYRGNNFTFNSTGSSGVGFTHLWTFPGATPNTSTAASPSGVHYNAPGTYTVTHTVTTPPTANTPLGCKDVQTTQVTVFPSPTFIPLINASPNGLICAGSPVVLTTTNGGSGYTYLWNPGAITTTTPSITVNPTSTTTYTVVAINGNGCTSLPSLPRTITVLPAPNASFTLPANQCFTNNNSFTFTNTGNSGTGFNQSWTFPGGTPNASNAINPPVVHYNLPGTYTITHTVTNAIGCKKVVQQTVTVYPLPTITITKGLTQTCPTYSTVLTASGAGTGGTYDWGMGAGFVVNSSITVSPTTATTYTVTVKDANGCTNTASINVVPSPCVVLPAECEEIKWPVQAGSSGDITIGDSVVTDKNGSVYVSGVFFNQVAFGSTIITTPLKNQYYFYLVKYDNCGNVRWVAYGSLEGPKDSHKIKIFLDVDPLGNSVYISSPLLSDLKVVDGTGTVRPVQPRTGPSSFIIKFDAITGAQQKSILVNYDADIEPITVTGNGLYQKNHNKIYHYDLNLNSIGSPFDLTTICSNIQASSIDSDVNGNVFITGYFQGTLSTTPAISSIASGELFILKMKSNLVPIYSQKGGANSSDIYVQPNDMYINGAGLYITGLYSSNSSSASPFSVGSISGTTGNAGFALKFNLSSSTATLNWAFRTINENPSAISANDTNGYIGVNNLESAPGVDSFIQHFNSATGSIITSNNTSSGIASDIHFNTVENAFFITGTFINNIQLGSAILSPFGDADMFTGRLKSGLGAGDFYKQNSVEIGGTPSNDVFNFYPNPVTDHSTIDFTLENAQDVKISIIDITGKTIKIIGESVYTKGNHKLDIDMSDLQSGFYFVRFNTNNKIIDKKLIKL